ncbi:MAG: hypothetical protein AAF944_03590 [Bacteroidota bacterium]
MHSLKPFVVIVLVIFISPNIGYSQTTDITSYKINIKKDSINLSSQKANGETIAITDSHILGNLDILRITQENAKGQYGHDLEFVTKGGTYVPIVKPDKQWSDISFEKDQQNLIRPMVDGRASGSSIPLNEIASLKITVLDNSQSPPATTNRIFELSSSQSSSNISRQAVPVIPNPFNIPVTSLDDCSDRNISSLLAKYDTTEYNNILYVTEYKKTLYNNYAFDQLLDSASAYGRAQNFKLKAGTNLYTIVEGFNPRLHNVTITTKGRDYDYEVTSHPIVDLLKFANFYSLLDDAAKAQSSSDVQEKENIRKVINNLLQLDKAISTRYAYFTSSYYATDCIIEDYINKLHGKIDNVYNQHITSTFEPNQASKLELDTMVVSFRKSMSSIIQEVKDELDDDQKTRLEKLPEIYEALHSLNKRSPNFGVTVPYQDELAVNVFVKEKQSQDSESETEDESDNSPSPTVSYPLSIVGGWKINASATILGYQSRLDNFFLEDVISDPVPEEPAETPEGEQPLGGEVDGANSENDSDASKYIIRKNEETQMNIALGGQLNIYYKIWKGINPAVNLGVAYDLFADTDADKRFIFNTGGGVLVNTQSIRFGLHIGWVWSNINALADGYQVGEEYTLTSREVPTKTKVISSFPYFGISINPKAKKKE